MLAAGDQQKCRVGAPCQSESVLPGIMPELSQTDMVSLDYTLADTASESATASISLFEKTPYVR
jgi:hypothetical protein